MTFFYRAVKNPKKSVEQLRFKQMDFEQLTLTLIVALGEQIMDKSIEIN
jgi:hypothetical protein